MTYYLNHYCERLAAGFWGEPFNLLSNAAFLIAGLFIWRALSRYRYAWPRVPRDIIVLVALLFCIALGSALWHLTAQPWALWGDRIPILVFMNLYLLSCLYRVVEVSLFKGIALFAGYHVINTGALLLLPADFLNRSIFYLPTWLYLAGLTLVIAQRVMTVRRHYVWAQLVFTVALVFRTIDNALCTIWPLGTHFIWHLLTGYTLYLLMQGLIGKYRAAQQA